ncbi:AraC family transcriptional regulator [Paenibacillus gorillae]|uniref:AraC family transcriptional regulator n=1 Tax=Paenibacillus gorillae TaxID=1243662 RepID=UPI00138AD8BD|nr:AraC family transcriptional regulator [Paenibacillus gorillae]
MRTLSKYKWEWFRLNGAWSALFWSYIAILLLLIVIGSLLYWRAKDVVEISVEHTNSAMLGQLRELADGQLQMIEQLEQQVASHPKLMQLMRSKVPLTDKDQYAMIEVADDLKRYKQLTPFIYDYYIYLPKIGTLLGPGVKTTPDILFGQVDRFEGLTAQDWMSRFQDGYHFRTFDPSLRASSSFGEERHILGYMQTLPLVDRSKQLATLFIMINDEQLGSMFKGLAEAGKGQIYIVDADNRIISATTDTRAELPFSYSDMTGDQGKLSAKRGGEDTVISYATSSVYGWKYVLEVPRTVFLAEVNEVRSWALLLFVLAAFSGAVVSGYLAFRNYRPIRDLVTAVSGNGAGVFSAGKQGPIEYELIHTSIQSARLTESELRARLSHQTPIIRIHFLSRFIRGYAEPHELLEQSLQFMGIQFVSDLFAIMLIDVEDMSAYASGNDEKERLFVNFVISNIASDLANERHIAYTTELDQGRVALLINICEADAVQDSSGLASITDQLDEVLRQRFRLRVAIGVSSLVRDRHHIGEAFRDALKRLDENRKSHAGPIETGELPDQIPAYYFPLDIEQQLTNYVKSGEEEKTEQLLDALYTDHDAGEGSKSLIISYFLMHLSSTLFRIVQTTPRVEPDLALRLLRNQGDSIADTHRQFLELKADYRIVCRHWKEGRSDQGSRMLDTIQRIVQERFGQNMLSVGLIADELGITQPYLSSFYKKATGRTILEFIAEVRLREAKRLLSETEATVAQIALVVGYSNDIGFIRFFQET